MKRWLALLVVLSAGGIIGAGVVVASTFVNRYTSTEAFCTSCHSMANVAADPHYLQSAHRTNTAGVLANCADCHVPANNWFVETYSHAVDGMRDGFAEYTGNFSDPSVWAARLPALAQRVRDEMLSEDGVTCRKCHDSAQIHPSSQAGQAAHAMLAQGKVTCITCHADIAHAPVPAKASGLQ
ncbi:MAG: NapC/NirT family cytochrome c [Xanthobacteraceae bacterium]